MSRRDRIRMSDEEVRAFLEAHRTAILCSNGPRGLPHPMPMWYALEEGGALAMTTFRKSQKVRNLERDPRAACLVEDGETYAELRGAVLYGSVELVGETERVLDVLERVSRRSGGAAGDEKGLRDALRRQAAKRVGLRIRPERVVSWDHRKLGGAY